MIEDLYKAHQPYLKVLALSLLGGSHADAEDCCQTVWVQVVKHLGDFRGQSSIRTWLIRITLNEAIMIMRKNKRHHGNTVSLSLDPKFDLEIPSHQPGPEIMLLTKEIVVNVRRAVRALPAEFQEAIVVAEIEDLGETDAARATGITRAAHKSRKWRARRRLMEDQTLKILIRR